MTDLTAILAIKTIVDSVADDGKIDLEEAWKCMVAIKKAAGMSAHGEVLKDVGECIAHKHYGGDLLSGCTKGYDINNGERIQVKARSIKLFKKSGRPQTVTAIKVSHFNFDKLVVVLFHPDDGSFVEMIEYTCDQLKEVMTLDKHDNIYVASLTDKLYDAGKKL